jgi:MazG family protein
MYKKSHSNDAPATGAQELAAIERFFGIIRRLRAPDGCPWDRKQTLSSMRRYVIEEGFEVVEGIDADDSAAIREELGDLFLITGMLSVIGEDSGRFRVAEVFDEISDKLVRRHPHVFGDSDATTPGAVEAQWEEIKRQEKERRESGNGAAGAPGPDGTGADTPASERGWDPGVSRSVPALERARRAQKSAAKEGFDWPEDWGVVPVFDKVAEELEELRAVSEHGSSESRGPGGSDHAAVEEELGDLLFAVVNLSRKLKVDPSLALSRGTDKFIRRFSVVMQEMGSDRSIEELESIWRRVKDRERE